MGFALFCFAALSWSLVLSVPSMRRLVVYVFVVWVLGAIGFVSVIWDGEPNAVAAIIALFLIPGTFFLPPVLTVIVWLVTRGFQWAYRRANGWN